MAIKSYGIWCCLDCSVRNVSVALIQDGTVLSSFNGFPPISQSEDLMRLIEGVFLGAGRKPADVRHVLFCSGPGSFTSLRIGLATLKGYFWTDDVVFCTASSLLFRCYSAHQSGDRLTISLIRLGRKRVAAGFLECNEKAEEGNFSEKIFDESDFGQIVPVDCECVHLTGDGVELLKPGVDLSRVSRLSPTDPHSVEAFWSIIGKGQFIKSDLNTVVLNYLTQPDFGKSN
ncbi:MAG TPA: tRNA (adenosine(37)-N6)-threonylcarbamoyltransferase complex dimerization subunit type 1 TsaB [bacterium]|nr:tRNA (adenosine(37)-N6)-threonylcarbamoyltransferase complex dimerization subunit type 1 TsaB [bacterium]